MLLGTKSPQEHSARETIHDAVEWLEMERIKDTIGEWCKIYLIKCKRYSIL